MISTPISTPFGVVFIMTYNDLRKSYFLKNLENMLV